MDKHFENQGDYLGVKGPLALPPICVKTGEKIVHGEKPIVAEISDEYLNMIEIMGIILFLYYIPILGIMLFLFKFSIMRSRKKLSASYYVSTKQSSIMYTINIGLALIIAMTFLLNIAYFGKIVWRTILIAVSVTMFIYYRWGRVLLRIHRPCDTHHYVSGISQQAIVNIVRWGEKQQKNYSASPEKIRTHNPQLKFNKELLKKSSTKRKEDYSKKMLTDFPVYLYRYSIDIEHLDMGTNSISEIPNKVLELTKLSHLEMKNNPLKKFPEIVLNLPCLHYLGLQNTRISQMTEIIKENFSLRKIDLSSNRLKKLPKDFHKLKCLEHIDLSNNQLNDIPEIIFNLSLIELKWSNNFLSDVPQAIDKLKYLQTLDLSHNQLTSLPTEIFKLEHLKHLSLKGNSLSSLPKEIEHLKKLEVLDISNNCIDELPQELEKLSNLQTLLVNNNKMQSFPEGIWLVSLKELDLSHNKLTAFHSICPELKKINLSHNELQSLHQDFCKSDYLEEINLSHNELTVLPEQIKGLQQLQIADFSNNFLFNIFRDVTLLQKLKKINLENNDLEAIPDEWKYLPGTCVINLKNNPCQKIPLSLVSFFGENLKYDVHLPVLNVLPKKSSLKLFQLGSHLLEFSPEKCVPYTLEQSVTVIQVLPVHCGKYMVASDIWITATEESLEGKEYLLDPNSNETGVVKPGKVIISWIKNKWALKAEYKIEKYYYLGTIKKNTEDYLEFVGSDLDNIYSIQCFRRSFIANPNFEKVLQIQISLQLMLKPHNCFPTIATFEKHENYLLLVLNYYGQTTFGSYIRGKNGLSEKTCIFYILQLLSAFKIYRPSYVCIMPENMIIKDYQLCMSEIIVTKPIDMHMKDTKKILPYELMNYQKRCYSFVSPEVLNKENESEKSFVFSLGILLYYMRTGKHPFSDKDNIMIVAVLENIIKGKHIPFPEDIQSEAISKIINKMLRSKTENRYATLNAIEDDIQKRYAKNFISSYYYNDSCLKSIQQETFIALETENAKIVWLSLFQQQLNHRDVDVYKRPSFITIDNIGTYKDCSYLACEYTSGKWLTNIIVNDNLSVTLLLHYAIEIISIWETLAVENIFPLCNEFLVYITEQREVKFFTPTVIEQLLVATDYSQLLSIEQGLHLSSSNEIYYRAPNEITEEKFNPSSQIYSLGILLYFAICKKYPYQKQDILTFSYIQTKYIKISDQVKDISPDLAQFIAKATAYTQEMRYQTLQNMKTDLEEIYLKRLICN